MTSRQATWALALPPDDGPSNVPPALSDYECGAVVGWYPTVPRGEVMAIIQFVDLASRGSA